MPSDLRKEIRQKANAKRAAIARLFFKTGRGEYGEGDHFFGLTVPEQRQIAQRYRDLAFLDVRKLLRSPYHEDRFVALIIFVDQFTRGDEPRREQIYRLYLSSVAPCVNNWDLVDVSAHKIVGEYLCDHPGKRVVLQKLARSKNLWERRVAMIATLAFIAHDEFAETLRLADILLLDRHDLIHKAVGWMLREVGKRDRATLVKFLRSRYNRMPRTMLRYAIEKFSDSERRAYLQGASSRVPK
ncbi:MAG: DNA alkylation repair protein [Candidatus Uhrbacteria bacterium]